MIHQPPDPDTVLRERGALLRAIFAPARPLAHGVTICPHNVYGRHSSCQWQAYGYTRATVKALREHMTEAHP